MHAKRIVAIALLLTAALALAACGSADASVKVWPAAASGKPSFYYFGSGT